MPMDDNPLTDDERNDRNDGSTPVVTICALTETQRVAAAGSVLVDLDRGVQLSFDLLNHRGLIRRRIHDLTGIVEDTLIPMEHGCAHCSLRDVVIRSLREWSAHGRPIVLALPPTTEPATIVPDLIEAADGDRLRIGGVLVAIDAATVESDLFGDDLLDERGIAQGATDRRAVGEVVAHQIEYADAVVFGAPLSTRQAAILDHLARETASRCQLHSLSGADLLDVESHDHFRTATDGCRTAAVEPGPATDAADSDGIWTIELLSDRPFSPDRLRSELPALGAGPLRGRGHFWLPTRPELRCVWDGAGGQLSVGPAGEWPGPQQTRLVITGAGGDPAVVRAAFDRALLTDAEYVGGAERWARVDDGMDPWLGVRMIG
ncbi:CobW family GTP-binding protein [Microlunatus soli]|uniref:GTPase, G3E family n=1 Tax=Microlunatus soli TaxID=630515 RepID=A0A1H1MY09_9ACTN|nr:GTP-binding protein [Microlunatus soli]SDR91517.1 GTPase, G3E family [Microlunatus soli]